MNINESIRRLKVNIAICKYLNVTTIKDFYIMQKMVKENKLYL